jgi:hypothetical protein
MNLRGRTSRVRWSVRRGLAVVALGAVVAGLALAPAASASVPPRDRVYASYLPTVDQVTKVYPYLAEGGRTVGRYRGLGDSFSCWDWTQSFLAADGRWAYYTLKSGAMPYFKGLEDPAAFVFKFHTRAKAMDAFWQQWRFVRSCMGRQSVDGTTARLWAQDVPAMGDGSVAYRLVEKSETTDGYTMTRELHIATLSGRYLVNIFNQAKDFQPDTRNGVRLVKITLGNIG